MTANQKYNSAKIISTKIGKNLMNKEYATFQMILPQNGSDIVSIVYYFPVANDFYILNLGHDIKDSVKYWAIWDKVFNSVTFE